MFRLLNSIILAATALTSLPSAQAQTPFSSARPIEEMRRHTRENYDKVYPYYVQACSMTIEHKLDGTHSGAAGHAVAYIKGICRDTSSPYPRVKVCEPGQYTPEQEANGIGYNDIANPNSGMGFSVSKEFINVNWVAVPGKDFFFRGNIGEHELVTEEKLKAVGERLYHMGTHKGIVVDPDILKTWDQKTPIEEFAAHFSVNLDVATNLARYLTCVNVPVKPDMLPAIVEYLNGLNDHYFVTKNFNWSGVNDNCTHLVDNILATIGFMPLSDTTPGIRGYLKKLTDPVKNLAIPADSLFRIATVGNSWPLGAIPNAFNSEAGRKALLNDHWIATQHGTLVDVIPPHEQVTNKVFKIAKNEDDLFMAGRYVGTSLFAHKLYRDPEAVDIRANLEYYKGRYEKMLTEKDLTPTSVTVLVSRKNSELSSTLKTQFQLSLEDAEAKLQQVMSQNLY